MTVVTRHKYVGRTDRDCETCGNADRDQIHRVTASSNPDYQRGRHDAVEAVRDLRDELLAGFDQKDVTGCTMATICNEWLTRAVQAAQTG